MIYLSKIYNLIYNFLFHFFFFVFFHLDLNADYLDMGFGRGSLGGGSSRTKRMRTSFKHHQLRTMKSYFAINHNPDAKDLKQLSQKTGLPKRVLQVKIEAESYCIPHYSFYSRVFQMMHKFIPIFFPRTHRFGFKMPVLSGGE